MLVTDINECQLGQHDCEDWQRCDNTIGSFQCARTTGCGTGYTLNSLSGLCEDDDECLLGLHNCKDLGPKFQCRNTLGSYRCEKVYISSQSPTRFIPVSPPEPAYSLPNYPVISGLLKRCLPGYRMNAIGVCEGKAYVKPYFDSTFELADINECESSPCERGEKCLNLNGRYHCEPNIQCRAGYELNDIGDACVGK